jgi:hypothetical protein
MGGGCWENGDGALRANIRLRRKKLACPVFSKDNFGQGSVQYNQTIEALRTVGFDIVEN